MAELFSLMPESTSCKNSRVAVSRTLLRSALPVSFQGNTFATMRYHQSKHQTPRPKELTHFRAPRAEMRILRVLVSSCLVFPAASEGPKNRGTKKTSETDPFGEIASIFKEFIF